MSFTHKNETLQALDSGDFGTLKTNKEMIVTKAMGVIWGTGETKVTFIFLFG